MIEQQIINKANYCLNCINKPCSTKGCPMHTKIPEFISMIKENNLQDAYKILKENNLFSYICALICPQEEQCEGSCIRGIKQTPTEIGLLEK
jgi:glutamate synthase (NADPH/NADH) small chain